MASALGDHLADDPLGHVEEPGEIDRRDRHVVVERVVGEGLPDVDPGIVDQRVDTTEPIERLPDYEFGGLGLRDVSRHHQHIRCCGRLDGKRRTHYGVTRRVESGSNAGTYPLRRPGDDRHLLLLLVTHRAPALTPALHSLEMSSTLSCTRWGLSWRCLGSKELDHEFVTLAISRFTAEAAGNHTPQLRQQRVSPGGRTPVEDRRDLLRLLLDGLEAHERDHVERAIQLTTLRKYDRLRKEPIDADPKWA